MEALVLAWARCRDLLLSEKARQEVDEPVEVNGRLVHAAEAELLECYGLEVAEEEAKKAAPVVVAEAPPVAKPPPKLLAEPSKRPAPKMAPSRDLGSGAMASVAAAAIREQTEQRSSKRPSGPVASARADDAEAPSVPKRAKKAPSASAQPSGPIEARAVAPSAPGAELPEAGFVPSLRTGDAPPPWESWTTHPLEVELPRLLPHTGNQTAILRVSVEATADRWALNIMPAEHDDSATVYFHFNPRRKERDGSLILNDKFDDNWGKFQRLHLGKLPPLFGVERAELAFQFEQHEHETTIYVALDRRPVISWTLRCDSPSPGSNLACVARCDDDHHLSFTRGCLLSPQPRRAYPRRLRQQRACHHPLHLVGLARTYLICLMTCGYDVGFVFPGQEEVARNPPAILRLSFPSLG